MLQTLQTALEVLDVAYSILLKGTRLELNFKPSPIKTGICCYTC